VIVDATEDLQRRAVAVAVAVTSHALAAAPLFYRHIIGSFRGATSQAELCSKKTCSVLQRDRSSRTQLAARLPIQRHHWSAPRVFLRVCEGLAAAVDRAKDH
jgi:hypothetical protein